MDHSFDYHHAHPALPSIKGTSLLMLAVFLHVTAVKSGFGHYDVREFLMRFGIDSLVSVMSGIGSICLAGIMGKHYYLRNKLLKKELKEKSGGKKDEETPEDGEEKQDSL